MVNDMLKFISLILLITVSIITGCSNEKSLPPKTTSNKHILIENLNIDNYFVKGKNQQYFTKIPHRVIVVGENETETLLELGAAPNILIAVAQNNREYAMKEKNWQLFKNLPTCKSSYLNMEYITQLKPDLIIAQQCVFIRSRLKNTEYWNSKGVGTLIPLNTNSPSSHFYQETVEKEMQFIQDLGQVFHLEDNATKIINDTYTTINNINEKNHLMYKPKVMVVEFLSSMISYDKTKLIGNIIEKIGGRVSETPSVIGFENIIKENPDILFVVCSHADYGVCINKILTNKALQNLPCVKKRQVYSIPLRFTYGTSCRTKDGLKFLADKMYPDLHNIN